MDQYEYCAYVEDDIVPEKDFFVYIERQLIKYKDDNNVFSINSYNQMSETGAGETYMSHRFSSWGTGYYKRSWENVEFRFKPDNELIVYNKDYLKKIDKKDVKKYAPDIYLTFLEHYYGYGVWNKIGDMWDVQCLFYMLANKKLAVTPYTAHSVNIGIEDRSGIHTRKVGMKKKITDLCRYIMVYTRTTGFFQNFYHKCIIRQ